MEQQPTPQAETGSQTRELAFGPVRAGERIASLDVLRGFAILGILFVNMQLFALPFMRGVIADVSLADGPWSEKLSWAFVQVFCTYKFISLFSTLFGAGMIVQMMRAQAKGRSFAAMYLRRLFVLALIGACHAILLWYGDILLIYAFTGLIVFFFRSLSPKVLLMLAAIFVGFSVFLSSTCLGLQLVSKQSQTQQAQVLERDADTAARSAPEEEPAVGDAIPTEAENEGATTDGSLDTDVDSAAESGAELDDDSMSALDAMIEAQFQPMSDIWMDAETRAYRDGPFTDALLLRSISYIFTILAVIFSFGWRVLGLFLFGAALMKVGFFSPSARIWQKRCLIIGLSIGLPLEITGASITIWHDFEFYWSKILTGLLHEVGSMATCLGYLGGMCLLANSGALKWLTTSLAAVGRMALTTYLSETILATALMYWWGLGWFGSVSHLGMIGLTVAIYLALVVYSVIWMRLFTIGPVEWIWRSLTYLRPQPIRSR